MKSLYTILALAIAIFCYGGPSLAAPFGVRSQSYLKVPIDWNILIS